LSFNDVKNLSVYLKVIEDDDGKFCPAPEAIPPDDLVGASLPFAGSELDSSKFLQFGNVIHLRLGRTPDTRPPSPAVKINEIQVKNLSDGIGSLEIEVHIHELGTDRFLGCSGQINGLREVDVSGRFYVVNAKFTLDQSRQRNLTYYDVKDKNIYLVIIEDDEAPCPCPPSYGGLGLDDLVVISAPFPGAELFQAKEITNLGNLTHLSLGLDGAPARVTLLTPTNLSLLNSSTLLFTWQRSGPDPVDLYQFQLAVDSLMTVIVKDTTTTNIGLTISAKGLQQGFYWWRVRGRNANGWGLFSRQNSFIFLTPTRVTSPAITVTDFHLDQNYPNPFNPETAIKYELPKQAEVKLEIFDITGRQVRSLVQQIQQAGRYTITWDGRNEQGEALASGVYLYQLRAGSFVQTRRMALVR
jgi:hypothetical protein